MCVLLNDRVDLHIGHSGLQSGDVCLMLNDRVALHTGHSGFQSGDSQW